MKVSWDYYSQDIWTVIKFHGSKPPTRYFKKVLNSSFKVDQRDVPKSPWPRDPGDPGDPWIIEISGDITYPLVNIQKAIENGHRNSGFSQLHSMVDLSIAKCKRSPEGKYPCLVINSYPHTQFHIG